MWSLVVLFPSLKVVMSWTRLCASFIRCPWVVYSRPAINFPRLQLANQFNTCSCKLSSKAEPSDLKPNVNAGNKAKPAHVKVVLDEKDIDEKHIRGWGNGGQKLNKTSSCVQLLHKPTGLMVVCQDTRSLQQNRKIALKRLQEKLDLNINGASSKIGKRIEKLKARKHKRRQRAKRKYAQATDQD
ncbi:RF-1 domain-containing protein [Coemansia mojavensis]|nr:RF-1 domain-containing protein [Coemansia mojavensis]